MTSTIYAAGYGRQPQKRANASEASPATQRSANKAEADRRAALPGVDLAWTRHYEDIGISAFTGKERPEFDRLLADCRAGRVNMIIVYYISRFSRMEPLDAIPIVTDLLNRGVTIVSVTEGEFRQGNIMDLIHLIMRLDAAHGESKNKSVAVTGAKKKVRELGGYVGGRPPYGRECVPETRYDSKGKPIAVQLLATLVKEAEVIQAWWIDIKRYKDNPTICRAERKGLEVPGSRDLPRMGRGYAVDIPESAHSIPELRMVVTRHTDVLCAEWERWNADRDERTFDYLRCITSLTKGGGIIAYRELKRDDHGKWAPLKGEGWTTEERDLIEQLQAG
ncbi:recombinase family protein [Streptomyces blastmyceticus]|uniref:Resolvase/invertase-type recombinase catalytic domain-containing protein n=1 Tax=Streptomyces blastmyceticus TaxID=68180 RepID=A0ABP3GGE9_9ACTN